MSDDLENFRVKTLGELWETLRQLEQDRIAMDIEFLRAPGKMYHARIEQLDDVSGTFWIRMPVAEALRQPAPAPMRLSSTQKKVKIQFDTVAMQAVANGEIYELKLTIPRNLFRIQRRKAFRIANCPDMPIAIRASLDGRYWIRKNLHDVSIGGCSFIFDQRDIPMLKPGAAIPHCVITVPEEGEIETAMEVRTVMKARNAPKPTIMKAGCQFVNLPFEQEAAIQRFITAMEQKLKTAV